MAQPLTYSHRPLSFAVPAVGGTALLPQTVALGVFVKVKRSNEGYFAVSASDTYGTGNLGRMGSVSWDPESERWAVDRFTPGGEGYRTFARFRPEHLRQAVATAIVDTATEYVLDRDDLG
jgi:hypothetical protein